MKEKGKADWLAKTSESELAEKFTSAVMMVAHVHFGNELPEPFVSFVQGKCAEIAKATSTEYLEEKEER